MCAHREKQCEVSLEKCRHCEGSNTWSMLRDALIKAHTTTWLTPSARFSPFHYFIWCSLSRFEFSVPSWTDASKSLNIHQNFVLCLGPIFLFFSLLHLMIYASLPFHYFVSQIFEYAPISLEGIRYVRLLSCSPNERYLILSMVPHLSRPQYLHLRT